MNERLNEVKHVLKSFKNKFENPSDFIIDVKKDSVLISIILSISSYGDTNIANIFGPITFWRHITLDLLDFKNKYMKNILQNIS